MTTAEAPPRIRWRSSLLLAIQLLLAGLYTAAVIWYLGRGTPAEDSVAEYPFDAGTDNIFAYVYWVLPWYLIAFAGLLSGFLGALGFWAAARREGLWRLIFAAGAILMFAVFIVNVTPFGSALNNWWLD